MSLAETVEAIIAIRDDHRDVLSRAELSHLADAANHLDDYAAKVKRLDAWLARAAVADD